MEFSTIYKLIKELLSEESGLSPKEITATMELTRRPLLYDTQGLRNLARKINAKFQNPPMNKTLTADQTGEATTVRSLADMVKEAYE